MKQNLFRDLRAMARSSWHLLAQNQQWKHQKNVRNLFKFNNKDTRTTPLISFWSSLMLTLNRFHRLFWCFNWWFWKSKCQLGKISYTSLLSNGCCFATYFSNLKQKSIHIVPVYFDSITEYYSSRCLLCGKRFCSFSAFINFHFIICASSPFKCRLHL